MANPRRRIIQPILNVVALLLVIGVNWLANALPINGQTTGEISDRFDVYFKPAGYAFSIWGLIYLGLVAFAVYQALPAQRDNPRLHRIDYLFLLSSLANIAWIFCWHYELFALSVLVMLILLATLIAIYYNLEIGRRQVPLAEKWFVQVPFSIYLAWITVATIANVTILLAYLNWNGWGISPAIWAVIMIGAGLAIGIAASLPRRDAAYLLVLAWSFAAIAVQQNDVPLVMISAIVAALAALLLAASTFIKSRRSQPGVPAMESSH